MGSYKKQLNLNAKDIMEKDYWDSMKSMHSDMISNLGPARKETLTETMLTRLRFSKQLDSALPAAGDEYGDYEKFEDGKNEVKEVNDKGEMDAGFDKFEANAREMLR